MTAHTAHPGHKGERYEHWCKASPQGPAMCLGWSSAVSDHYYFQQAVAHHPKWCGWWVIDLQAETNP